MSNGTPTLQTDRLAVPDGNGNTAFVRSARMGWGVREKVKSGMYRVVVDAESGRTVSLPDIGRGNVALMLNNIICFEGPDLGGKPVTEATLDELDPDFGDAILAKIQEVNKPRENPNPKSPTTNGSSATGADGSIPSVPPVSDESLALSPI